MKINKPNYILNQYQFENYKDDFKYKLSCPGIYVYKYDDVCLYVGATQSLWCRAFRIFQNGRIISPLLQYIIKIIKLKNIEVECYFCQYRALAIREAYFYNKLKPISQIIYRHKFYETAEKKK